MHINDEDTSLPLGLSEDEVYPIRPKISIRATAALPQYVWMLRRARVLLVLRRTPGGCMRMWNLT